MRINSFLIKFKLNKYGEINLFKIFLCLHFMKKIQDYIITFLRHMNGEENYKCRYSLFKN